MKTAGAVPSHPEDWVPKEEDQKHYPHFDAPLRLSEIRTLVNDPDRVARNPFFPLIHYEKKWQPFRTPKDPSGKKKAKPKPKGRKIRYAARRDAYIFARYRKILSPLYEAELVRRNIQDIPIAYRKIPDADGKGKCNIDFAKDAFDFIQQAGDCFVVTLDISKFFESIDHSRIEKIWNELLGTVTLPPAHKAVFKALTNYHWVDRIEAYRRLGFFGKKIAPNGEVIEGYLRPWREIPTQLCSPAEFREKIAGKGKLDTIISTNEKPHGIPQGTPVSDLVANMYLMEFDVFIKKLATKHHGRAFRYSDDILLVVKAESIGEAEAIEAQVRNSISSFGNQLIIKEEKSSIHQYMTVNETLDFKWIKGAGKNGLEYLGFRFDGSRVFLRDSTLANLKRKMKFAGRVRARRHKKRYVDRDNSQLIATFNFDDFFQTFLKVEEFDPTSSVKNWTFWTYVRRATETFGAIANPINRQLRYLKPDGRKLVETELSN